MMTERQQPARCVAEWATPVLKQAISRAFRISFPSELNPGPGMSLLLSAII
jgi:hypothetical protein